MFSIKVNLRPALAVIIKILEFRKSAAGFTAHLYGPLICSSNGPLFVNILYFIVYFKFLFNFLNY